MGIKSMETASILYFFLVVAASVKANTDLVAFEILELEDEVKTFDTVFIVICSRFVNKPNVSTDCKDQLNIVCDIDKNNLLSTMLDASSKFPWPGLQVTSFLNFGNYDQCVSIDHEEVVEGETIRILGKHCVPGFVIPIKNNTYQLSICIPNKCTKDDLVAISGLPLFIGEEEMCSTKEGSEFTIGDIAIMVIYGVFLLIIVISTAYDVYLHKTEKKPPSPLLLAFSFLSNGKKLFQTSKGNREQILIFHGLKFISIWWIMAGHTFSGWRAIPVLNRSEEDGFVSRMSSFYMTSAPLSVDTFFFISGFLLAYQYLKQKPHSLAKHLTDIPKLILHRYLRLTPVVLMAYLYMIGILNHTGSGPIFIVGSKAQKQTCLDHWWSFFLYVQNYVNSKDVCLLPTWYLSADMQLFLTAPIAMIPVALYIKKHFKMTMIGLLILNIIFAFIPLVNITSEDLWAVGLDTHSRFICYWIGFMLGAYIREKKDKPFRISWITNMSLWVVVLGEMFTTLVLYEYVQKNYGYTEMEIFFACMRPAWCIGLAWIVFACYHGYGGFVNWFLSSAFMQIGSKLTYCIYLTHGIVVVYFILTGRTIKYFTAYNAYYEFCGAFITSLIISIVATLSFESPLIILEKAIFGTPRKPAAEAPNGAQKTEPLV